MSSEHPTDSTLMLFVHGQLADAEAAALAYHLRDCRRCAREVQGLRETDALMCMAAQDHVTADVLSRYQSGASLTDTEREHAEHHLALCPRCRDELDLLSACDVEIEKDWEREERLPEWWTQFVAEHHAPPSERQPDEPSSAPSKPAHHPALATRRWRWALLPAAALVTLFAVVTLALKLRTPSVPAERVWMLETSDPNLKIVEGGAEETGTTSFRWAMRGLLSATAFRNPEGTRVNHLVALGFSEDSRRPNGLIQIHDPLRSRKPSETLVAAVPLVPDELMPYDVESRWQVCQLDPLPVPGEQRDDLLATGYDTGWYPIVLVRFRYSGDDRLDRLGAYFHAGTVSFSRPARMQGKTVVFMRGKANVPLPPGMPGPYLQVAGLLDVDRLDQGGVWQNPTCRGAISGSPLPTGAEIAYAFFAPLPGFPETQPIVGHFVSGPGGEEHVVIEASWRRYAFRADGSIRAIVESDTAAQTYGPTIRGLVRAFMGGLENQVVRVPPFSDPGDFDAWLERWYEHEYRPAVEEWALLVEPEIQADRLSRDFVDKYRLDMAYIRSPAPAAPS